MRLWTGLQDLGSLVAAQMAWSVWAQSEALVLPWCCALILAGWLIT